MEKNKSYFELKADMKAIQQQMFDDIYLLSSIPSNGSNLTTAI